MTLACYRSAAPKHPQCSSKFSTPATRKATPPSSPLPDWGTIFGDTVVAVAVLDRLMHNAIVFNTRTVDPIEYETIMTPHAAPAAWLPTVTSPRGSPFRRLPAWAAFDRGGIHQPEIISGRQARSGQRCDDVVEQLAGSR